MTGILAKSSIARLKTYKPNFGKSKLKNLIPMARLAHKNEYRSAVKFLCTDESSYMTGQNIIIDGGRSVW